MLFRLSESVQGFSLMVLSCGERRGVKNLSIRQGWTWHCTVQVCTENPWVSQCLWDSLSPWTLISSFLWPEIQDIFLEFNPYCIAAPAALIRRGAKSHKRERGTETKQWESYPCQITSPGFDSFLPSAYFVYISVFKLCCILPRIFSQWGKWGICGWSFVSCQ